MIASLAGSARASNAPTSGPPEARRLEECPVCGTYFEKGRGLEIPEAFHGAACSTACREKAVVAEDAP